ncbi:MAG: hypothetical protein H0U70_03685 [Tatlockia sp.]|nr:hypothetical protein [Tatlockia sp.]
MKILSLILALVVSTEVHAVACKCSCDPTDNRTCASLYDIDYPCGVSCNTNSISPAGFAVPMGRTACPTVHVYNQDKGIMEWRTFCIDSGLIY